MIDLSKYLAKFDEINIEQELKEKENTEIFYDMLEQELIDEAKQYIITLKVANGDL